MFVKKFTYVINFTIGSINGYVSNTINNSCEGKQYFDSKGYKLYLISLRNFSHSQVNNPATTFQIFFKV